MGNFGLSTSHSPGQDLLALSGTLSAWTPLIPTSQDSDLHTTVSWFSLAFSGSLPSFLYRSFLQHVSGISNSVLVSTSQRAWTNTAVLLIFSLSLLSLILGVGCLLAWVFLSPQPPIQDFSVVLTQRFSLMEWTFPKVPLVAPFFYHLLRSLCPKPWVKVLKPSSVDYMLPSVSLLEVPTLYHSESHIAEGHPQLSWPVLFCSHVQIQTYHGL